MNLYFVDVGLIIFIQLLVHHWHCIAAYLGDTLGAGGGVDEAARARVRCAWAKFKELSPILTARGASHRMKGKILRACVQSVLIYGTETWAMKADNLHRPGESRAHDGEMDVWGVSEG